MISSDEDDLETRLLTDVIVITKWTEKNQDIVQMTT